MLSGVGLIAWVLARTRTCLGRGSTKMLPDAKIDDYVLVHVGVAISKVNEEEAKKTFKYLEEIGELGELEDVEDYLPKKDEQ